jgi:hypothetical protein
LAILQESGLHPRYIGVALDGLTNSVQGVPERSRAEIRKAIEKAGGPDHDNDAPASNGQD